MKMLELVNTKEAMENNPGKGTHVSIDLSINCNSITDGEMQVVKLPTPKELINTLASSDLIFSFIKQTRTQITDIIHGRDDRLLVIVGPCSIHDTAAALDYAVKLIRFADNYVDDLLIVMRTYLEKPRTRLGWKGLIYEPNLDGDNNIAEGLRIARELLLKIAQLRLPVGTEFLSPLVFPYISDLIAWSCIGARTCESQIHRELASGLVMPVGFKNTSQGDIQAAINSVLVARHPHSFINMDLNGTISQLMTAGNSACHIILRGAKTHTNYHKKVVAQSITALQDACLPPYLVIDCSHGNSGKQCVNQPYVAASVAEQIKKGSKAICGVMLESFLLSGNQPYATKDNRVYGKSITDECLGWDETMAVLEKLALATRKRRKKAIRNANACCMVERSSGLGF